MSSRLPYCLLILVLTCTCAYAQTDKGVTMSTDPAKISDIEMRAQALQARQDSMQNMQSQSKGSKSTHHKKSGAKTTPSSGSSQ